MKIADLHKCQCLAGAWNESLLKLTATTSNSKGFREVLITNGFCHLPHWSLAYRFETIHFGDFKTLTNVWGGRRLIGWYIVYAETERKWHNYLIDCVKRELNLSSSSLKFCCMKTKRIHVILIMNLLKCVKSPFISKTTQKTIWFFKRVNRMFVQPGSNS